MICITSLKDYVFVKIIEMDKEVKDRAGFYANNLEFHCIRFYNVQEEQIHSKQAQLIMREFSDVFKEKLTELPPVQDVEHRIDLTGSLPKLSPIYKLTPKKDQDLK